MIDQEIEAVIAHRYASKWKEFFDYLWIVARL